MKIYTLLMLAVLSSVVANAQDKDIFKNKPWEEWKQKMFQRESLKPFSTAPSAKKTAIVPAGPVAKGVMEIKLKGTLMGTTRNGDQFYAMQPDNMPCVVPGKEFFSNMPVAGLDPDIKKHLPQLDAPNVKDGEGVDRKPEK